MPNCRDQSAPCTRRSHPTCVADPPLHQHLVAANVLDMEGIYAMYFTGVAGSGHAVFVMKSGVVAGADAAGGLLDGSYKELEDGMIDVSVTFKAPAGTALVTGTVMEDGQTSQVIEARLPRNLGDGNAVPVKTPTGPINVIFKRIRNLP